MAVHDGDTLTILDGHRQQHRVRLSGVDAPEGGQPFGKAACSALVKIAKGKQAKVQCHTNDRYRREVCIVTIGGVDAGKRQVERGLSWVFTRYAPTLPATALASYQVGDGTARAVRIGLWADDAPAAPWVWRTSGEAY